MSGKYWGLLTVVALLLALAGCAITVKVEPTIPSAYPTTTIPTTAEELVATTTTEPATVTEPTTESTTPAPTEPPTEPTTPAPTQPTVPVPTEPAQPSTSVDTLLLVNPWNYIPDGYKPDLVTLSTSIAIEDMRVDKVCYDDLVQMMKDCNKEAPEACVVSAYRTWAHQEGNFKRKVQKYLDQGYSQEDAERFAAMVNARPGTSEHQTGLAVDIIDTRLWKLVEAQEELPAQKWLMENSWKYGFILRYQKDKTNITGVIYEPWHYRYVGKDAAKAIYESGLTLEEYLAQ